MYCQVHHAFYMYTHTHTRVCMCTPSFGLSKRTPCKITLCPALSPVGSMGNYFLSVDYGVNFRATSRSRERERERPNELWRRRNYRKGLCNTRLNLLPPSGPSYMYIYLVRDRFHAAKPKLLEIHERFFACYFYEHFDLSCHSFFFFFLRIW